MCTAPERQLVVRACMLVAPALGIANPVTGIPVNDSVPATCGCGSYTAPALSAGAFTLGTGITGSYNFQTSLARAP